MESINFVWLPRSHDILKLVCLQKDAKQCCEQQRLIVLIVFVINKLNENNQLLSVTALFGVSLKANEHKNLRALVSHRIWCRQNYLRLAVNFKVQEGQCSM